MKRINRKVSEATKKKIAEALRGKSKTAEHKQALSKAMMAYWATIPKEENEAER
ncbi:NUMOD3 domain-containing DNA-binding protein [uncultured Prevotella sp.]|uniref:NUMOD3 domain-containing DNA-binding protein n=1 Tax=uncultured Prevotella sp. TaxID=159272 RepID=UPI0025F4CC7A|nr:NUMOD3 domain-containing DNA-binding protein [uncultured Prevotella sp.]